MGRDYAGDWGAWLSLAKDVGRALFGSRKSFQLLRREGETTDIPRTRYDYEANLGDILKSAPIVAAAMWIARNFPEAPVVVRDEDGELDNAHRLARLFREPNPYYGGSILRTALGFDFAFNGNAYIEIGRGGGRMPVALYYQQSSIVEPQGSETKLITHYQVQTSMGPRRVDREDMVHFRMGLDPRNPRRGFSALGALLREVYTDEEAANFTAAILRNMGFPGIIISPAEEGGSIGPKARGRLQRYFRSRFRGDQRGEVLTTSGRLKIDTLSVDLSKLNLNVLRQIPEERVAAVSGIPAAVLGFGTGLEQTKVGATMKELRELAYENVIVPYHRLFGEELSRTLLLELDPQRPMTKDVVFDLSDVRVLQEDENQRARRVREDWNAGLITRAEARAERGMAATPVDDVYKLGISDVLVPAGQAQEPAEERALPAWAEKALKQDGAERRAELVRRFLADWDDLTAVWSDELAKQFDAIARQLADAWLEEQVVLAGANGRTKAEPDTADQAVIERVMLAFPVETPDFAGPWLRTLRRTGETIESVMGLGVMLDDPIEREVVAAGGTRRGLIDLSEQTREAMYRTVVEARAEGLGPPETARRIRDGISAGPWRDVRTRATVIARTETKYAQNVSSMALYTRAENVTGIQVFDAQIRDDTDEPCVQINGRVFSVEEARGIAPLEHPNCSRSFAPVVE